MNERKRQRVVVGAASGEQARRRRRRWIWRASALLVGLAAASSAYFLLPEDDETPVEPAPEFVPVPETTIAPAASAPEPADTVSIGVVVHIQLDEETGRVAGAVNYATTRSVIEDNARGAPPEGATGGRGILLPVGACGFSDPCHDGLPRSFVDDLDGIMDTTEFGPLPSDSPLWHEARTRCYISPWSIADCNLELAIGGYGGLVAVGMDETCLVELYTDRTSFAGEGIGTGWWRCGANWWQPAPPIDTSAACAIGTTTPAPTGDQVNGDETAGQTPRPLTDAEEALAEMCRSLTAAGGQTSLGAGLLPDNSETAGSSPSLQATACQLARLVADARTTIGRHLPPCNLALRPPIDTQQLRAGLAG